MISSIRDQMAVLLSQVPGLPSFAVPAIAREVEACIAKWQAVTKDDPMPALLSDSEECDWGVVMALVGRFGGQRVYIPKMITSDHVIAVELGIETATTIAKVYGGLPMDVPKADELLRLARNRAIIKGHESGRTPNQLAQDHNLAYPWVVALISKHKREEYDRTQPRLPGL